jgi:hypothetical protein
MAMQKRDKTSEVEAKVGIFWWFQNKLILDSTPLSKAEPYGDALTHATGHIDHWAELQKRGVVPLEAEYEEPPRGRVGYDKREERFFLRADKCIIDRKAVVEDLMTKFSLPPDKTSVGRDDHYSCAVCLKRRYQREQS